ncbi:Fe(3+) ABC transporter substrate-binding protein [Clostridium sp. B9]|uniref:Fe(3+) ABC transporter substrate-binding protein n=1 Tax=Clostridium sp. B9 TaxID=3423224 RepID=UPI003D2ECA0B
MLKRKKLLALALTAIVSMGVLAGCGSKNAEAQEGTSESGDKVVNVYSSRHYDVDKQLFKDFEADTGIKVNLVDGKSDELIERMAREGENSPADVFLTVGAENIAQLKEKDLIKEITSEKIDRNIPEEYRGKDWVGLTSRARIIVYNKDKVNPETIKTYEDLTKEEFKGKVLTRSSSSSYNVALLSSFIQLDGAEEAKEWAQGMVNNFARKPEGNDRDQAKAIMAGIGDVGIMNSYYISKMINSSDAEEAKVGKEIGVLFPENTHLNLSFGAVTKSAKNEENAVALLEYLTEEKAQKAYVDENGEFALNPSVGKSELQKSWGDFTVQDLNYETLGESKQEATLIFDQVGWK